MRFPFLYLAISYLPNSAVLGQNENIVTSPDHNIVYTFRLTDTAPDYKVSYKGKVLLKYSPLKFSFLETGIFGSHLRSGRSELNDGKEAYKLVVGKTDLVQSNYREMKISLEDQVFLHRKIILAVRVFDDGVAFRFEFPAQKWSSYTMTDESSEFNINGNPLVRTLFRPNYTTSHEGLYDVLNYNDIRQDTLMDIPALFEFNNGVFMAITEAALIDYSGMYLSKNSHGSLVSRLSPLPGQETIKVKANIPHRTPWRVLMISDRIGALIESNILTNLNEPCRITDVSWIKPGKTTFPWWNGDIVPDTSFAPGNNFETNKYYIDFCARNKLEYHSVVEYGGHEWYVNDGENFYPGPNADVTKPIPGLNMQEICDYAKSKGVGIRVWVHWKALYPKLEEAFAQYERWGIQGLMVDFMDRDDQEMVNIQAEILRRAAVHKLHIQFHGAYKPTGLHRTWPNEFTREGVMNYEYDKWSDLVTPDHDINIPFTRMLAGPTDYHLGGFRAVQKSKFKIRYTRPLVIGTRSHMLAMYVVLENYIGMVCDYPEAYLGQPGFDFIKEVPTTWDETKVIGAKAGEWISIARKKNSDWFIGTITNSTPREVKINFTFLPKGEYTAKIYSDTTDQDNDANLLEQKTIYISNKDSLLIKMAPGGGQAIHIISRK